MSPFRIIVGEALERLSDLPDRSVRCCVTSPPYWGLRDYDMEGQIGLESSPLEFVQRLVAVFDQVRRVLTDDGTCWVNLGDTYSSSGWGGGQGSSWTLNGTDSEQAARSARAKLKSRVAGGVKAKDLIGIPWRVALALQGAGWWLRSDVIWEKPNVKPESVRDRPTKSHEYVFLLSKSERYYYDARALREKAVYGSHPRNVRGPQPSAQPGSAPHLGLRKTYDKSRGRNARTVWRISTTGSKLGHRATFPLELPRRCLLASSQVGDVVLDPFAGLASTGVAALTEGRRFLGIELNPTYASIAVERLAGVAPALPLLSQGAA